uniref:Chromo domain-containing protein n=1 Tax=Chenopodium quinoa TaxID=63459 RepID=A0A803N426_CHEQI
MEAQIKTLEQCLEDHNSKIEHKFEEMMKLMQAIQAEKVSTPISEPSTPSSSSNDSFTRSNPTRTLVDWNDFVVDLYARFRDNSTLDAVEQFNKLQQIVFVGGLKPTVKPFVRAFKPSTIASAIDFARLQEENLTTSAQECEVLESDGEFDPQISVHALAGSNSFQTMRVKGVVNGKDFHILIDSGSTHNFVDMSIAAKLVCHLEQIPFQSVVVADGNHIPCTQMCKSFSWMMQGHKFDAEVLLIPLGSCDMVLGIQWLRLLGPIHWDFQKLKMEFDFKEQHIELKRSLNLILFQGKEFNYAGHETIQPEAILDRRIVKLQNHAVVQYLVQWAGFPSYEVTWELAESFEQRFLDFLVSQT